MSVCAVYGVNRAAAVARASEAKMKKPTSPQQFVLSSIGRDLDRYETNYQILLLLSLEVKGIGSLSSVT